MPGIIPVGEQTSLGIGRETTPGVAVTPTIFHGIETFTPTVKNMFIAKGASRRRSGMSYPTTGPIDLSMGLRVESTPDTLGQPLAIGFGAQSTPSGAPTSISVTNTAAITGNGSAQSVAVTGSTSSFTAGSSAIIAGGTNSETVAVTVVGSGALTINPVNSYPAGSTITLLSSVAKTSKLSFGSVVSQLPTMTLEYNRVTDAVIYYGATVDQIKFALDSAKGLSVDFTMSAFGMVKQPSPASPTYSTKDLFAMEALATSTSFNGAIIGTQTAAPSVLKWDCTLNNQLTKNYRGAGSARQVYGFPLGQRKVSGSMTLGFESEAAQIAFWGTSTGPGAIVTGVPIILTVGCQDYADPTLLVPYSLTLTMPLCALEAADIANKTSGELTQLVNFSAYEVPGQNNDLTCTLVNTASTTY